MADLPLDPELPTNNEGQAEVPRRSLNPDPEVRQPSTWAPTSDEERRIFRVWKGFTLAERSKDTLSWVWNYGCRDSIQNIPTMDLYAMRAPEGPHATVIRIQRHPKC
ncbi:hypothetical protein QSH57_004783 [Fusarium oxysporum f. sp. vasinfectum]|nr:hypothetical protein QSH57_004783 [Fusarium oxysporum f. sp. vasinfectum]